MLLHEEVERVLQVLVAIDEDLVVAVQIIDEVLHEEEIVSVERCELDRCKVFPRRLRFLLARLNRRSSFQEL